MENSVTLPANQALTGIEIQTTPTYLDYIDKIEGLPQEGRGDIKLTLYNPTLVLHELFPTHKLLKNYMSVSKKTLQYYYWQEEITNITNGVKNYSKLFNVDGSVTNVYAILKYPDSLLSNAKELYSYRWRINNIDRTQRDVVVGNALETDTIIQTINSSNIVSLRNLQTINKYVDNDNKYFSIPMCSLPEDGMAKQVMLNLTFNEGLNGNILLYLAKEAVEIVNL